MTPELFARVLLGGHERAGRRVAPSTGPPSRFGPSEPGWSCYLASVDGEALGAGALAVDDGVGYLASAVTLPAGRRRGCQQALIRHRLRDASAAGCELAVTLATPGTTSHRNLERAGFGVAYTKVFWTVVECVHAERIQRLVFGEVAEDYERHRPDYPGSAHRRAGDDRWRPAGRSGARDRCRHRQGDASTAAAADSTSPRSSPTRRWPPSPGATRRVPRSWCRASRTGRWCPTHFAVVVAAQSWHWVDDEIGPRKAADALRPGGWIALMWNRPDLDDCAWHDELATDLRADRAGDGAQRQEVVLERGCRVRSSISQRDGCFGPPDPAARAVVGAYTSDEYIAFLNTHSDKRMLPEEQRAALFDAIRTSLDAAGGVIEHPYVAELVAAPRLDR